MGLTIAEIKEKLKEPKNRGKIADAVKHHNRLKFHSSATLERYANNPAVTDFLRWVEWTISKEKFVTFTHLFRFPVKTVSDTSKIYTALEKVFHGQNPVFDYNFLSNDDLEDWQYYRKETLNEPMIWQTKGFECMKVAPNSLIVVDLPAEQQSDKPEPYFYFLDIDSVIDWEEDRTGINWIAFKVDKTTLAYFDRENYQTFKTEPGTNQPTQLISESAHDLGQCPVNWFWSTPVTYQDPFLKKAPISTELSRLDELLKAYVYKSHLDGYAGIPIYWGYEQNCDYEEADTGNYCDGGYIRSTGDSSNYLISRDGLGLRPCPKCQTHRLHGPGTFIEVPAPDEDTPDMRDPVGMITADITALDYNTKEVQRQRAEIYTNVTGHGGELQKNQALNEKQVLSAFESQKAVLRSIKKNFESIQEWTTEIVCKLRYGSSFKGVSISYGTDFYLATDEQILQAYNEAKAAGDDDNILDDLLNQYNETKYRNNQDKLNRVVTLSNLDPLRHLSKSEAKTLYDSGLILYNDFYIKTNFSTLIKRFERENISVTAFGANLDFAKKVDAIEAVLVSYVPQIEQPQIQ